MQSTKGFREEFDLDTIYELIKEQAPRLVGVLQTKYCYEKDKNDYFLKYFRIQSFRYI